MTFLGDLDISCSTSNISFLEQELDPSLTPSRDEGLKKNYSCVHIWKLLQFLRKKINPFFWKLIPTSKAIGFVNMTCADLDIHAFPSMKSGIALMPLYSGTANEFIQPLNKANG